MHDKCRHARVLANRPFVTLSHVDIRCDDAQRLRRLRCRLLFANRLSEGGAYIGRKVRGRLRYQLDKAVFQKLHVCSGNSHRSVMRGGRSHDLPHEGSLVAGDYWTGALTAADAPTAFERVTETFVTA